MDIRHFRLEIKVGKKIEVIYFEANNDPRDVMRVARAIAKYRNINLKEVEYEIHPN